MLAAHWRPEGNGGDGVFACVPDDGSVGYQQTAQLIGGTWSFDFYCDVKNSVFAPKGWN